MLVGKFSEQEIREVIWKCDIGEVMDQMDILSVF